MPQHEDWPRQVVHDWALGQVRAITTPRDSDLLGYCPRCETFRRRRECVQVERDECCLYACCVCGSTIDESPPF